MPANELHVNTLIQHALRCRPLMRLVLRTGCPIELPNDPLISQHLTKLELRRVDVRSSTLDFSGCPALLHLRVEDSYIWGNISSPFLKHLSIIYGHFMTGRFRARIYLPGLVSLELHGFFGRTPVLVESMTRLVSSIVRINTCLDCCPKNDYGGCDDRKCKGCYNSQRGADDWRDQSVLLKGLSQVAALELWIHPEVFIINRDLKLCPTFSKLKTLLLSKWCPGIASDLNILSCFLKHSPILEKLTLQLSEEPKVPVKTQRSYTPSKQSFAFTHLKIVEIKCDKVGGRSHKVLDILSTFDIPLEKVTIQQGN
uniref:FBD domain-containing protein n=1 Tax=Hordeum vulgare subsp. vulgare TaxID=112509 RepID=A0A8I6Y1M7_HORVV